MSRQDIKKHIIASSIECIEEYGVQAVTVRTITEKAGVNTAAINYYFGSKDDLIQQALEQTLENLFVDWEELLGDENTGLRNALRYMLKEILAGAQRYPNITKAHLYDPLINNCYDGMFVRRFNSFLNQLAGYIQHASQAGEVDEIRKQLVMLFSAALFPAVLPGLFEDFSGMNFTDEEKQDEYIDYLLDKTIIDLSG